MTIAAQPRARRRAGAALLLVAIAAAALALADRADRADLPPAALPPAFDAIDYFAGSSAGRGTLHLPLAAPRALAVASRGIRRPDGSLLLLQSIGIEGRPVRRRHWQLRRVAPGRYAGTLSDAAGPVEARIDGRVLTIRFPLAYGLRARQDLVIGEDRQTLDNRLRIGRFGIAPVRIDETIRRARPLPGAGQAQVTP